jgi:CheY-like chemotaxis protein
MVNKATWNVDQVERAAPSVVVVDPQFDAYRELAASARAGRIDLHFRSSGTQAMKLARHLDVDAWLVAGELDDMSGHDFVELLGAVRGDAKVAMIGAGLAASRSAQEAGADRVVSQPITVAELEELLGLPVEERTVRVSFYISVFSEAQTKSSEGVNVVLVAVKRVTRFSVNFLQKVLIQG